MIKTPFKLCLIFMVESSVTDTITEYIFAQKGKIVQYFFAIGVVFFKVLDNLLSTVYTIPYQF